MWFSKIIRMIKWVGYVARMVHMINAYKIKVGKPEGKRPLRGPRRRWDDNIRIYVREKCYVCPCHHDMASPRAADGGDGL
jgi:hypothetical protein